MDIDLVYLWVNGNDPQWIARRNACIGKPSGKQDDCKARYADSGELKYSLRSVEKYAPWIHKIYIITDHQVPEWLDTSNPKVQIVDHTEILPPECLPCFNSTLLEHFIHCVPGLSEFFIYGNDDTYLNQQVSPGTFFAKGNLPIIYMIRKPLRKLIFSFLIFIKQKILKRPLNHYMLIVRNAALLVEKKYGTYYSCKPHHNFDAYRKSTIAQVYEDFQEQIKAMYLHHTRYPDDVHRSLYNYVAIACKLGHLQYVNSKTSFTIHIHKRQSYKEFEQCNPAFFCVNDSEHATDDDRSFSIAYLEKLFPNKSSFEI